MYSDPNFAAGGKPAAPIVGTKDLVDGMSNTSAFAEVCNGAYANTTPWDPRTDCFEGGNTTQTTIAGAQAYFTSQNWKTAGGPAGWTDWRYRGYPGAKALSGAMAITTSFLPTVPVGDPMAIGGNSSAQQAVSTPVAPPPSCAMALSALSIKPSTQQHGLQWVPAMVAKLFNSLDFPGAIS